MVRRGLSSIAPILAVLSIGAYGQALPDIPVPMGDRGALVLTHPRFIEGPDPFGAYRPRLTFDVVDHTTTPWNSITIHFDIGATCNGGKEIRQWSVSADVERDTIKTSPSYPYGTDFGFLEDRVRGCRTELIRAQPCPGGSMKAVLPTTPESWWTCSLGNDRPDLTEEIRSAQLRRANTAKGLAEKRKREQAEEDARVQKVRADEEAKTAAQRAACSSVYRNTANKKLGDLTVKELQQVQACQTLGMYPPH